VVVHAREDLQMIKEAERLVERRAPIGSKCPATASAHIHNGTRYGRPPKGSPQ